MPFITSTVTTTYGAAICDICGAATALFASNADVDPRTRLLFAGWLFLKEENLLQDTKGKPITTVCPLCARHIVRQFPKVASG
jgi:hypothetical protein